VPGAGSWLDTTEGIELQQPATISLQAAQDRVAQRGCTITLDETQRGYVITVGGNPIHSKRADLLTFLTVDGAVNYVARHLAPAGQTLRVSVELCGGSHEH